MRPSWPPRAGLDHKIQLGIGEEHCIAVDDRYVCLSWQFVVLPDGREQWLLRSTWHENGAKAA